MSHAPANENKIKRNERVVVALRGICRPGVLNGVELAGEAIWHAVLLIIIPNEVHNTRTWISRKLATEYGRLTRLYHLHIQLQPLRGLAAWTSGSSPA